MKKQLWMSIGINLILCSLSFAAKLTMEYTTQPAGGAFSLPISFGVQNLAPIPQALCSPTLAINSEKATCSGLPLCKNDKLSQASFSCVITSSCNTTVPGGGTCSLELNVTLPNTIASSTLYTFAVSHGSYNTPLVSNAFVINGVSPSPPASSYRTITFKNSCNYSIWFGSISGAAPTTNILTGGSIDCTGASGDAGKQACVAAGGACYARVGAPDACYSQQCTSDSNCMSGASCSSGKCFWNNATPTNNTFLLTNGQTNTISIPEYESNGIGIVWSGAFGGRTGCTSGTCTSALCTQGTEPAQGVCTLGTGFQQPATQGEFTFISYATNSSPTPTDSYDVEVINGANVPLAMYPTNTSLIPTSGNPYVCGAPGYNLNVPLSAPVGSTIGASTWSVSTNAPNVAYRDVVPSTAPAPRCTNDGDCDSGQFCGLAYGSQSIGSTSAPGLGQLVCGTFAGWFTADQICGTNSNFTNAVDKTGSSVFDFSCNATPSGILAGNTMSNLYQCNADYATSCYSTPTTSNCCGCVDWNTEGITLPTAGGGYVQACNASNTLWTGNFNPLTLPQVFNTISFLKESCPSCYSYPFDDKSSSFTCDVLSAGVNTVGYTVEFCPGGAGASDFQP